MIGHHSETNFAFLMERGLHRDAKHIKRAAIFLSGFERIYVLPASLDKGRALLPFHSPQPTYILLASEFVSLPLREYVPVRYLFFY
jgi:hypothetical protein